MTRQAIGRGCRPEASVLLCGNIYGAGNIGDDAIARGVAESLQFDRAQVVIATQTGLLADFVDIAHCAVSASDSMNMARAIRSSSHVVCGGGTLIGEELGVGYPLRHLARVVALATIIRRPVFLCSIGANHVRTTRGMRLASGILSLVDAVTVRDVGSHDECVSLGVDRASLCVTGDPAVATERLTTERSAGTNAWIDTHTAGRHFFVNVVNEVWAHRSDYKVAIAAVCDYASQKYDLTPVFICNEVRAGAFYDHEANRTTAALLRSKAPILLDPVYFAPGEMVDVLSTGRFLLTMRLHGVILAAVAGTPSLAIARADKVRHLASELSVATSPSIDDVDIALLCDGVDRALAPGAGNRRELLHSMRQTLLQNRQVLPFAEDRSSRPSVNTARALRLLCS